MAERNKQYVGVCGISTVEEAKRSVSLFREAGFDMKTAHIPMWGFQASWKTLAFGFSEGNRRVPTRDDLPYVLEAVNGEGFVTIHYYTKQPELLVQQLRALLELGAIYRRGLVDGVQLNKVWPTTAQMAEIKAEFPQLKIILQMSPHVTAGMSMEQVAVKLANGYSGIDYIILDSSGGRGIEFDMQAITSEYQTLKSGGVKSDIVFAGGFSGENVAEKLSGLIRATNTTSFSIDAEGGLRDKLGEGYGNDAFNAEKARTYLKGAAEVLLQGKRT